MKLKQWFFVFACVGINYFNLAQDVQSPPDVKGLHDVLNSEIVYQEYQDDPLIWIAYFDLDHDGIPEVLATHKSHDYSGSGGGGYVWFFYQFKDGQW